MKKFDIEARIPLPKLLYASVIIIVLLIAGPLLIQNRLPPEIPLFYGLPEGEDQLSAKSGLLIPGVASLCILIINLVLSRFLQNTFIKKALISASFCVCVLATITILRIAYLVGNF